MIGSRLETVSRTELAAALCHCACRIMSISSPLRTMALWLHPHTITQIQSATGHAAKMDMIRLLFTQATVLPVP